ncbi:MAG: DUF4019 domain-containing protein [Desulfobacteraceae bacterium]
MDYRNKYFGIVVLLVLSLSLPAWGQGKTKDPQGKKEVFNFLEMVDRGDYAGSYELTSAYFQGMVNQEKWVELLKGGRPPLGSLLSRNLIRSESKTFLPGAPDGFYLVFTMKSSFQNKKSATETVTLEKEKDGTFKVSGYYIR